ncbi:enoyl-CoA hydratase/isomerase family protein [Immundisolibacter sp.]|uniref:enoyl-CoA hydratase/isomerase family protein n=1 Tax=Immundisolibacter sp. TaxID=1934948 RepID=UPI0035648779
MSYDNLLYEVAGPLALITLNRPRKLNAISLATVDDLHAAIAAAGDDPVVRVIALTGAGDKAFAAGSDLGEVVERDLGKALEPIVQGIAERLERCPKPTIAAINGICFGGGLEIALGCDLRVAGKSARFATPEGKLGIIPGGGATQRLPRLVGRAWALDMLLTGEPIDAERALQIGLVTRLVEDVELLPTVRRLAAHLASFAPLVPRYMKAMVHAGMEGSLAAGLALEKFAQAGLCETADKKEGLAAFLEKRPPNWTGR